MMRRSLSISKRIMIIISGVTAATLSVGFLILLFSYVQSLKDNLTVTSIENSILIGQYTAVPLLFEDKLGVEKSLSSLVSFPSLQKAVIYDNNRNQFAFHQTADLDNVSIGFHEEYTEFRGSFLHVFKPIVWQGTKLGTIYLIISTEKLDTEIRNSVNSILLLLFFLFSISLVLSFFLQKSLTTPIKNLANVMDWVTHNNDYSVRVEKSEDDEIGTLYKDFNSMLERIEASNKQLIESSEKFSAVVRNTHDAILILQHGLVQYANPSAIQYSGFSEKSIINKKFINFVDSKNKGLVTQLLNGKIKNNTDFQIHQIFLKRKDKSLLTVEMSVTQIEYLSQISSMVIIRDITQRKKSESEKEKLEEQIRRAQKMETIGRLAGGIAHDFNNILTPIIGYSSIAMSSLKKEDKFRTYFSSILKASERAKDLIQQILTFSRQMESDHKPLKLDLIIQEALQLLRPSIPSSIEIRQEIKECSKIMADGTQIHQIIMNLCTNAYHAMAEKGGVLSIGLKEITVDDRTAELQMNLKTGRYAQLSISDTGIGMQADILEHIFEPFFTTKKVGDGTGLGLSVVHGIVQSYNGNISVYSEPDKGTVFHIYLPVRKNDKKVDKPQIKAAKLKTGNERILIVDDEIEIIRMLKLMLENLGYSVVEKTDSVEALKLYMDQKDNFDLIITDLTMPNLSGLDFAKEVQEIKNNMPIILTTGFADPVSKEIKAQYNIKAMLIKPVVNSDLADAIRSALD